MRIKGAATYIDVSGSSHRVEGKIILQDDFPIKKMRVDGKLSFENISCDKLSVEGKCEGETLTVKNLSVDGKIKADVVKVEQLFEIEGKAKIDEVEADEVIIDSRAGYLGEVRCRKIKIFNTGKDDIDGEATSAIMSKIFGAHISLNTNIKQNSRVSIKKIDADKVELENCEADEINCRNASVGRNCVIDRLVVSGEYEIAADSKVGEIIKKEI